MKQFMDKDFLLSTPTAQHLFHDYADKMPIVDYHCHINLRKSQKTESSRILHRYGSAVTTISGVR